MFAISLGDDKAELRPLEIWQDEEFLAHMDRARELVDPWIPFASFATDRDSGLLFDVPAEPFPAALWDPLHRYLESHRVVVR
ncbi:hypothetical protein ABZ943_24760, partial [Streptomyces rubiginosohelvolus]